MKITRGYRKIIDLIYFMFIAQILFAPSDLPIFLLKLNLSVWILLGIFGLYEENFGKISFGEHKA